MKKFSGKKIHFVFGDHVIDLYVSRPNKGGHTHNHIYNVLYRSTFHKGPRSVGVMKPYYRSVLLKAIEQFGYGVSNGRLILTKTPATAQAQAQAQAPANKKFNRPIGAKEKK